MTRQTGYMHSLHAIKADKGVLQRVGKGMTAVQGAGNIWRRKGDDKGARSIGGVARLGVEEAALFPPGVPGRLDGLGVVGLEVRGIEGLDDLLVAGIGGVLEGREGLDGLLGLLLFLRLGFIGVLLL